jgi:hypothetical protein
MLWNTPKHQFGSNGVEWILHNFGIPKQFIQTRNTSFAYFNLSKVYEMLRNTPKHHFGSKGDLSQLWYPEIVHLGSERKFCILLPGEGLRNALKHSQKWIWVQWSRMDASQLRYPETVYSGPKYKFCIFLPVEGLWNAPKHSQTSFLVQWRCFATFVPRNSAFRLGTQVLHLFTCRRLAKCSETLPKIN